MTPVLAILAVTAAGLGALVRYLLAQWSIHRSPTPGSSPRATVLANLLGSGTAGAAVAAVMVADAPAGWLLVLGGGFAGGLSTFSTLAVDVLMLWRAGRRRQTFTYVVVTLTTGIGAAAAGWYLVAAFV